MGMPEDVRYFVTVEVRIREQYASPGDRDVLKASQTQVVAIKDFPAMARVLSYFHRAFESLRKLGGVI